MDNCIFSSSQMRGGDDILWSQLQNHLSGRWSLEPPSTPVLWSVSYISLLLDIELFTASCIVPDINNGRVDNLAVGARASHDQGEQMMMTCQATHCVPQLSP